MLMGKILWVVVILRKDIRVLQEVGGGFFENYLNYNYMHNK